MADIPHPSEVNSRASSAPTVEANVNNVGLGNEQNNNNDVGAAVLTPVQAAMLQQMTTGLLAGVLQNMPGREVRTPMERIKKTTADDFLGESTDPTVAEDWLDQTKWCMNQLEFNDGERLLAVQSLLKGAARKWWDTVQRERQGEVITWELFLQLFERKYISERYKEEQRNLFMSLRQGRMTVAEYERDFLKLERYAMEIVNTEERRCQRFEGGLNETIRLQLAPIKIRNFADLVDAACVVEKILNEKREKKEKRKMTQGGSQSVAKTESTSKKPRGMSEPSHVQSQQQSLQPRSHFQPRSFIPRQQSTVGSAASVPSGRGRGSPPQCSNCGRFHSGVCFGVGRVCFGCGSKDHFRANCPHVQQGLTTPTVGSAPSMRGGLGRGQGNASDHNGQNVNQQNEGRGGGIARTYALRAKESTEDVNDDDRA